MFLFAARKLGGYDVFLHYMGSALWNKHSLPQALMSAAWAAFFSYFPEQEWLRLHILQANAYTGVVSFVVSFVVVYRSQIAYQRYNDSQKAYFGMCSKLHDFVSFMTAFLAEDSKQGRLVHKTIIRWVRAFHNLVIEELKGIEFDPDEMRTDLTAEESALLREKRPVMLMTWIQKLVIENPKAVLAGDAILSRAFQINTDANTFYNECRRICETPFPFPFVQTTFVIIHLWVFLTPIIVAAFFPQSYILAPLIAGSSTWILFAVNEVASILENPWEVASNNLPSVYYTLIFEEDMTSLQYVKYPSVLKEALHSAMPSKGGTVNGGMDPKPAPAHEKLNGKAHSADVLYKTCERSSDTKERSSSPQRKHMRANSGRFRPRSRLSALFEEELGESDSSEHLDGKELARPNSSFKMGVKEEQENDTEEDVPSQLLDLFKNPAEQAREKADPSSPKPSRRPASIKRSTSDQDLLAATTSELTRLPQNEFGVPEILYHTVHGADAERMSGGLHAERERIRNLALRRAAYIHQRVRDQRSHVRHSFLPSAYSDLSEGDDHYLTSKSRGRSATTGSKFSSKQADEEKAKDAFFLEIKKTLMQTLTQQRATGRFQLVN